MKKIEAYIKTHRLDEVIERLLVIDGLTGVSIHDIKGFGRSRGHDEPIRIVDNTINWTPHVKVEIFCTVPAAQQRHETAAFISENNPLNSLRLLYAVPAVMTWQGFNYLRTSIAATPPPLIVVSPPPFFPLRI
jgi:nitrogen regulatory protein PII